MIVNYSDEPVIKANNSIFLAGPTPREKGIETWRKEAIRILKQLKFDGIVYVPEKKEDNRTYDYTEQVWWEREALFNSSVIAFWVPRDIEKLPAFTTNVEFGYWLAKHSSKVIYGRPDNSVKNKYLDWLYETETNKSPENNLFDLMNNAKSMVKTKSVNKN